MIVMYLYSLVPALSRKHKRTLAKLYKQLTYSVKVHDSLDFKVTKLQNNKRFCDSRTIQVHVTNINNALMYKCLNDTILFDKLQRALILQWKPIILDILNINIKTMTPMNTAFMQNISGMSDHRFETFKRYLKIFLHKQIFSHKGKIIQLRRTFRMITQRVEQMMLRHANPKRHGGDVIGKYHVYFANINEALSKGIDACINSNKFVLHDIFDGVIWAQWGGDKQTKYGYVESTAVLTKPLALSPQNTIPTLVIPKDIKDDYQTLQTVYQAQANKCMEIEALCKFPLVLSFVKYAIAEYDDDDNDGDNDLDNNNDNDGENITYVLHSRVSSTVIAILDTESTPLLKPFENDLNQTFDNINKIKYNLCNSFIPTAGAPTTNVTNRKTKIKPYQSWLHAYGK